MDDELFIECTQALTEPIPQYEDILSAKKLVARLELNGTDYDIYSGVNSIGRNRENSIVLDNKSVSGKHAVIEFVNKDTHIIYDLGSRNKTQLGKLVLSPTVRYHIKNGDTVQIADERGVYHVLATNDLNATASDDDFILPTPVRPRVKKVPEVSYDKRQSLCFDESNSFVGENLDNSNVAIVVPATPSSECEQSTIQENSACSSLHLVFDESLNSTLNDQPASLNATNSKVDATAKIADDNTNCAVEKVDASAEINNKNSDDVQDESKTGGQGSKYWNADLIEEFSADGEGSPLNIEEDSNDSVDLLANAADSPQNIEDSSSEAGVSRSQQSTPDFKEDEEAFTETQYQDFSSPIKTAEDSKEKSDDPCEAENLATGLQKSVIPKANDVCDTNEQIFAPANSPKQDSDDKEIQEIEEKAVSEVHNALCPSSSTKAESSKGIKNDENQTVSPSTLLNDSLDEEFFKQKTQEIIANQINQTETDDGKNRSDDKSPAETDKKVPTNEASTVTSVTLSGNLYDAETQAISSIANLDVPSDNIYTVETQMILPNHLNNIEMKDAPASSSKSQVKNGKETAANEDNKFVAISSKELYNAETQVLSPSTLPEKPSDDVYTAETQMIIPQRIPTIKIDHASSSASKSTVQNNKNAAIREDISLAPTSSTDLYDAETQVMSPSTLLDESTDEMYNAETQLIAPNQIAKRRNEYAVGSKIKSPTNKGKITSKDLYDAETQVMSPSTLMDESADEIYGAETQFIVPNQLNMRRLDNADGSKSKSPINKQKKASANEDGTVLPTSSKDLYDAETQVMSPGTLMDESADEIYSAETQFIVPNRLNMRRNDDADGSKSKSPAKKGKKAPATSPTSSKDLYDAETQVTSSNILPEEPAGNIYSAESRVITTNQLTKRNVGAHDSESQSPINKRKEASANKVDKVGSTSSKDEAQPVSPSTLLQVPSDDIYTAETQMIIPIQSVNDDKLPVKNRKRTDIREDSTPASTSSKDLYEADTQVISPSKLLAKGSDDIYNAETQLILPNQPTRRRNADVHGSESKPAVNSKDATFDPTASKDLYEAETQAVSPSILLEESSDNIYSAETQFIIPQPHQTPKKKVVGILISDNKSPSQIKQKNSISEDSIHPPNDSATISEDIVEVPTHQNASRERSSIFRTANPDTKGKFESGQSCDNKSPVQNKKKTAINKDVPSVSTATPEDIFDAPTQLIPQTAFLERSSDVQPNQVIKRKFEGAQTSGSNSPVKNRKKTAFNEDAPTGSTTSTPSEDIFDAPTQLLPQSAVHKKTPNNILAPTDSTTPSEDIFDAPTQLLPESVVLKDRSNNTPARSVSTTITEDIFDAPTQLLPQNALLERSSDIEPNQVIKRKFEGAQTSGSNSPVKNRKKSASNEDAPTDSTTSSEDIFDAPTQLLPESALIERAAPADFTATLEDEDIFEAPTQLIPHSANLKDRPYGTNVGNSTNESMTSPGSSKQHDADSTANVKEPSMDVDESIFDAETQIIPLGTPLKIETLVEKQLISGSQEPKSDTETSNLSPRTSAKRKAQDLNRVESDAISKKRFAKDHARSEENGSVQPTMSDDDDDDIFDAETQLVEEFNQTDSSLKKTADDSIESVYSDIHFQETQLVHPATPANMIRLDIVKEDSLTPIFSSGSVKHHKSPCVSSSSSSFAANDRNSRKDVQETSPKSNSSVFNDSFTSETGRFESGSPVLSGIKRVLSLKKAGHTENTKPCHSNTADVPKAPTQNKPVLDNNIRESKTKSDAKSASGKHLSTQSKNKILKKQNEPRDIGPSSSISASTSNEAPTRATPKRNVKSRYSTKTINSEITDDEELAPVRPEQKKTDEISEDEQLKVLSKRNVKSRNKTESESEEKPIARNSVNPKIKTLPKRNVKSIYARSKVDTESTEEEDGDVAAVSSSNQKNVPNNSEIEQEKASYKTSKRSTRSRKNMVPESSEDELDESISKQKNTPGSSNNVQEKSLPKRNVRSIYCRRTTDSENSESTKEKHDGSNSEQAANIPDNVQNAQKKRNASTRYSRTKTDSESTEDGRDTGISKQKNTPNTSETSKVKSLPKRNVKSIFSKKSTDSESTKDELTTNRSKQGNNTDNPEHAQVKLLPKRNVRSTYSRANTDSESAKEELGANSSAQKNIPAKSEDEREKTLPKRNVRSRYSTQKTSKETSDTSDKEFDFTRPEQKSIAGTSNEVKSTPKGNERSRRSIQKTLQTPASNSSENTEGEVLTVSSRTKNTPKNSEKSEVLPSPRRSVRARYSTQKNMSENAEEAVAFTVSQNNTSAHILEEEASTSTPTKPGSSKSSSRNLKLTAAKESIGGKMTASGSERKALSSPKDNRRTNKRLKADEFVSSEEEGSFCGESVTWSPRSSPRRPNAGTKGKCAYSVLFTCYSNEKQESIVKQLGGTVVDSLTAADVLVTDKVRRTVKFLAFIGRGQPIVEPNWIVQSKKMGRLLDPWQYLLHDLESEKKFSFSLEKSLKKASKTPVLSDFHIFITNGVQPPIDEMKVIILNNGGRILSKIPDRKWPTQCVVVSSESDKKDWKEMKEAKIVSAEWLLSGVLKQELETAKYRLQ